MSEKPKFSIDLKFRIKNITFYNEEFIKGLGDLVPDTWQKIKFDYNLNHNIDSKLVNETERKVTFVFTLKIKPDLGIIKFIGDCILESPDQAKISFLLQNFSPTIIKNPSIVNHLLINCFKNASIIAKSHRIPFPPPKVVFSKIGIPFKDLNKII